MWQRYVVEVKYRTINSILCVLTSQWNDSYCLFVLMQFYFAPSKEGGCKKSFGRKHGVGSKADTCSSINSYLPVRVCGVICSGFKCMVTMLSLMNLCVKCEGLMGALKVSSIDEKNVSPFLAHLIAL